MYEQSSFTAWEIRPGKEENADAGGAKTPGTASSEGAGEPVAEEWRAIEGFDGRYEVSSHGRVRSISWRDGRGHWRLGKMLSCVQMKIGYRKVSPRKDGKTIQSYVHILVARAFIPNPLNKPEVNHKRGTKAGDGVDNLEWATPGENIQHAYDTGLNPNSGERHTGAKLTHEAAAQIKALYRPYKVTLQSLADRFGVKIGTVRNVLEGRTWKTS